MKNDEANGKKSAAIYCPVIPTVSRHTNRATMTVNRGVCVVGIAVVQIVLIAAFIDAAQSSIRGGQTNSTLASPMSDVSKQGRELCEAAGDAS